MESTLVEAAEYTKVKTLKKKLTDILDKEEASIGEVLYISHNLLLDALTTVLENSGEKESIEVFKDFYENAILSFKGEILNKIHQTKH